MLHVLLEAVLHRVPPDPIHYLTHHFIQRVMQLMAMKRVSILSRMSGRAVLSVIMQPESLLPTAASHLAHVIAVPSASHSM